MGECQRCVGTGYHVHIPCAARISSSQTRVCAGTVIAKGASEEPKHWEFYIRPQKMLCTAEIESHSWGQCLPLLQKAGASLGKAQSALPKQNSTRKKPVISKVYQSSRGFFWFFFCVSISFMGPGAGCQHSELLTAPCNFCKCPVIK